MNEHTKNQHTKNQHPQNQHPQNLLVGKRVAVIGGGPGGLILARLLQMDGVDVKVYERDVNRDARVQGASLNINAGEGLVAVQKAGLMDAFRKAHRPGAGKTGLAHKDGSVLLNDIGEGQSAGDEVDGPNARPEIDRGPLRQLLLDALRDDTVEWNKQFASLSREDGRVHVAFKDGTTARADLVVACDGASSKVRPYVTSTMPHYSGITLVEGAMPNASKQMPALATRVAGGKLMVMGDSKTFSIDMKGDDTAVFYFGFHKAEGWAKECGIDFGDAKAAAAWFAEELATWEPMWIDVVRRSTSFTVRPQFFCAFDQHWEPSADLTLLGDAAHVMPPYAGAGVNNAMRDAVDLADALLRDGHADLKTAIGVYEDAMCRRAATEGAQTKEFTRIFHSPEPLPQLQQLFAELTAQPR